MKFLIVFEHVPENASIWIAETDDPILQAKIKACHLQYVNATECDASVEATISGIETWATQVFDSTEDKADKPLLTVSGDFTIIVTGFIM